jgi:hypothetical protein
MLRWLVFRKGPMTGLAIPGAAFIRVDDEKYIPVHSQMETVFKGRCYLDSHMTQNRQVAFQFGSITLERTPPISKLCGSR